MVPESEFDAARYWRKRHERYGDLRATGTLGAPVSWQRWLYRGKLRAYQRAFHAAGVSIEGARVLNFGCGHGYFENVWESLGAKHTAGIDLVEEVINVLSAQYPNRTYRAGNLADDADLIAGLGQFDLVTAIDVFYHVIDDAELERVISRLAETVQEGGCLFFTDALTDRQTAPHVKFRPIRFWKEVLSKYDFSLVHQEPVFVLQNRPTLLSRLAPRTTGAIAYWLDVPLTRLFPLRANNFALVARREAAR